MNNKKLLYLLGVFLMIIIIGMLFPGTSYSGKMTQEGYKSREGASSSSSSDFCSQYSKDKLKCTNDENCTWDDNRNKKCKNK